MTPKTKLQIIREMREYYLNNPRGTSKTGYAYCSKEGNLCAVGRCFKEDIIEEQKSVQRTSYLNTKYGFDFSDSVHDQNSPEELLKEEYKGHNEDFWLELQQFHDTVDNWVIADGGNSLSERGEREYQRLLTIFGEE